MDTEQTVSSSMITSQSESEQPNGEIQINNKSFLTGTRIVLVFAVIVLVVLGVCVYIVLHNNTSEESESITQINTPTPVNTLDDETNEVSISTENEKKLFQGEGFSFSYPQDLQIVQQEEREDVVSWRSEYTPQNYMNNVLILRSSESPFSPLVNGDILSLPSHGSDEKMEVKIQLIEETPFILGEQQSTMYTISCGVDCYYHLVRFSVKGKYYEFIANGAGGGLLTRFDNILSTFKFE